MSGTFIWVPSYCSAVTTKPNVNVSKYGDGYEQRVSIGLNSNPRQGQVTFSSRPNATADAIEAFLLAQGAAESFDWVPTIWRGGQVGCTRVERTEDRPFHSKRYDNL